MSPETPIVPLATPIVPLWTDALPPLSAFPFRRLPDLFEVALVFDKTDFFCFTISTAADPIRKDISQYWRGSLEDLLGDH